MSEAVKAEAEEEEAECLLRSTAPSPPPVVTRPLLFTILMDPSILHQTMLMIPKKFVKKHRHKLSTVATLVLPGGGDGWLVRLREVDNNLWFADGWHEFVVRNSICAECLLVFQYEGDSIFKVIIFNLQSCEVDCRENPSAAGKEKQFSVSHEKEIENSADKDNRQVRRQSTRDVGVQFNGTEIDGKRLYKPVIFKQANTRKERDEPSNLVMETEMLSRKVPRTKSDDERERTIRSAENFKPSNPNCRIVIRHSFLKNNILYVPAKFASEYLLGNSESVTLEDSNGKQWHCRCISNRSAVKLSQGWSKFVKDKHLEEGDVCVFELMEKEKEKEKKKNVVLKVTIFSVSSHLVTSETKPQSEVQA